MSAIVKTLEFLKGFDDILVGPVVYIVLIQEREEGDTKEDEKKVEVPKEDKKKEKGHRHHCGHGH